MHIIKMYACPEYLTCQDIDAGNAGEHLSTELEIYPSEALRGDCVYCLRFCTESQAKKGGMSVTGRLKLRGGALRFALPAALTEEGELRVQLLVFKDGERIAAPTLKGSLWVKKPKEGLEQSKLPRHNAIRASSPNPPVFCFANMDEFSKKNRCVLKFISTHEGIPACGGLACNKKEDCNGKCNGQYRVM